MFSPSSDQDDGRTQYRGIQDRSRKLDIPMKPTRSTSGFILINEEADVIERPSPPTTMNRRLAVEAEPELPRSTSTSSSLEYYFSIPTDPSPLPPLPIFEAQSAPSPDPNPPSAPLEHTDDYPRPKTDDNTSVPGGFEEALKSGKMFLSDHTIGEIVQKEMDSPIDEDERGSPWTIEAVDGDLEEERDKALDLMDVAPRIRTRSSAASESGGEEILYPRQVPQVPIQTRPVKEPGPLEEEGNNSPPTSSTHLSVFASRKPFLSPARKAHKRSSDDFAIGQGDSTAGSGSEKPSSQRPSTAGATGSTLSGRARDKRRERQSEIVPSSASNPRVGRPRPQSANLSLLAHNDAPHHRHGLSSRESSIPKSPTRSTSNLALAKNKTSLTNHHVGSTTSVHKEKDVLNSPRVAHSLLRGTQEGWSALDDEATAEALRKLDGVSGKSMRARGSISSIGRISLHSRPATPGTSKSAHTHAHARGESETSTGDHRVDDVDVATSAVPLKETEKSDKELHELVPAGTASDGEANLVDSGEEQLSAQLDKDVKKNSTYGPSIHFTAKRGSVSSTAYTGTPTTSSRDSGSMSTTTAATSISATSGRVSSVKARRNSASSDVSSVHSSDAASQRDRAALLISGEPQDVVVVPPVPPLPKDLSNYKSPPQSSCSAAFPPNETSPEAARTGHKPTPSEVPSIEREPPPEQDIVIVDMSPSESEYAHVQTVTIPATMASPVAKTPSKKWSLSNALNLKRSSSPSSSSRKSASILSPYSNKSATKDISTYNIGTPKSIKHPWNQKDAMASAASLASLSSLGSVMESSAPPSPSTALSGSTNRGGEQQRLETASVHAVNLRAISSDPSQQQPRSSPSSKSHRELSSKRLTPSSSSIPFFRRSSSQSMQIQTDNDTLSTTSVREPRRSLGKAPVTDMSLSSPSGITSHRKPSMLSLGLPYLLKGSSSRRSLQTEKSESSSREAEKSSRKEQSSGKKSDKEKSEGQGRLSVLMVRKRGKTVSSSEPKKAKPIDLPPIQMSAIPSATTEKLANLKPGPRSTLSASPSAPGMSSRVSSQTISSMQKQTENRNSRHQQLPTIAGSPSVNVHGTSVLTGREPKLLRNSTTAGASLSGAMAGLPKETPTRIPRIASRSSTLTTPPLKGTKASLSSSRRASLIVGAATVTEHGPVDIEGSNEFGVMEVANESGAKASAIRNSYRLSPSTASTRTRLSHGHTGSAIEATARRLTRDSTSLASLRKSSSGSVASSTLTGKAEKEVDQRHSALSPSKSLSKLLSPKLSLASSRLSTSSGSNLHIGSNHTSSWRQSITTPSPAPSPLDDDEILGDEEMIQYVRRQQARKLANGAKKEDLDGLFNFPEPIPPGRPRTPQTVLNSDQAVHLADYERKEILDYPSVYFFGNKNDKKAATRDNSTNNYSYDDDRGDYIIHNHDHLAYRYEIIDTLGKGSFGQVLHCRDYCTGQSVAIKIIRNKKRFHHQALVEIKILENLRKWDPDEKHHVIKMTEHFYFRNHLCIAMELLSINLYELIKANGFSGFSTTLIRRFTNQMLLSLCLMRHHRIVHCDLKPENVLLRHPAKSAIKVIDFGSSCFENEKVYTYIQSRFYRSPEVILGMNYNMAIDMWSLGCILAELYTGYPIFPGENEQEQLSCIMEVLGVPDKDLINRSSRKRLFFDSTGAPRPVINSKGRRRRAGTKTLAQVLRCDDELFVDFISKCLSWDPERRMKPHSAMRHPFVTAGRRAKSAAATSSYTSSRLVPSSPNTSLSSRKLPTETPKKSQISAPTPLAARSIKATVPSIPTTPISSSAHLTHGSSVKSYRVSQSTFHSSRAVNGLAVASAK